jgi:outer membrane immunogenic protein
MALIRYAIAAQLVVLSTSCFAADPRPRADQAGVAPSSFYIGVQGGMVWSHDKMTQYRSIAPLFKMEMSSDAAFGGLHVGYQRMIDRVIVGLEVDYDYGGKQGRGVYTDSTPTTFARTYQIDYRGTLRAKLGYDFGTLAIYATGGGAMTALKTGSSAVGTNDTSSESAFGFGATVGAGVSYKLSRHWAAFSEYRYADYGHSNSTSDAGIITGAKAQHRVTETSVRAGATYHFR